MKHLSSRLAVVVLAAFPGMAAAAEQEAIDGCIDHLRTVGGPDGRSGQVVSSDFSEAATVVILRDAGGTTWRCMAYSDGTVAEMRVEEGADDGAGAMAGSAPRQTEQRVQFPAGSTGDTLTGSLGSSDAVRYILGAADRQFLTVDMSGDDHVDYTIYVPDGEILFESHQGGRHYSGQLYESGDHVVEVFYNGNVGTTGNYSITFDIR